MRAEAKSFKFLSMEGKVKIPFFQRTYVWDEDNWDDLLDELLNEKKNTNFLGSIILKQLPSPTGEPKQLEVIDGQQRLTTLSILLKALYDSLPDEIRRNCEGDINGILLYRKDYTSREFDIKIEHSYIDSEAYKKAILSEGKDLTPGLSTINDKSHKILRCYKFYSEKFKNMKDEEKNKILNKILNPENKMLVVIDIDEKDDEQAIFDTLNTAGVRLTSAEIIKNALFKRALELNGNKQDVINFYKETWEKTFLQDDETKNYWEKPRATGRITRDNLEILLHCFGVIKGFYDPDQHALSELSKLFKDEINKKITFEDLKEFTEDIIQYAKIYKEKFIEIERDTSFKFEDYEKRLFHILDILEISTFHPYILYVYKNYNNDNNQIKEKLLKLEKFLIKNMLAKYENVKNYNKLCKQFINDEQNLEGKLNNIQWDKVAEGLRNINNRQASLLLFWIELYRRYKDERCDIKELKDVYSLEHIMPQKWEEYWNFDKVPHPNSNLTLEKQKEDRNKKIYWIGNMTLLKSKLNISLRNLNFEKKMNGEGRKKGIKDYAELLITKDNIVKPFENADKIWNELKIENRTNKLEEEIKEIWG